MIENKQQYGRLISNPAFQQLHHTLMDKTAFQILGVEHKEVPFSQLLGWLLDPNQNHGLGVESLKHFIWVSLRNSNQESGASRFDAVDTDSIAASEIEVLTEYSIDNDRGGKRRIDVLVKCLGKPVLVIECKINAQETNEQTVDYQLWADAEIEDEAVKPLLIYLTPKEDDLPSSDSFEVMNFDALSEWLSIIEQKTGDLRAKFLISELNKTIFLEQRAACHELESLVEDINEQCSEALVQIRKTSNIPTNMMHYRSAFEALGIHTKRTKSKGFSASVDYIKEQVDAMDIFSTWMVSGGLGSCTLRLAKVQQALTDGLGLKRNALNCELFMDRTAKSLKLSFYNDKKQMLAAGYSDHQQLRYSLVNSLRCFLKDSHLSSALLEKEGFNVFAIPFTVQKNNDEKVVVTELTEGDKSSIKDALGQLEGLDEMLHQWIEGADFQGILSTCKADV